MDRRTFLVATASVGVAGCVAKPAPGNLSENGAMRSNSNLTSTTNPVRCQGEPVSVEQSLTDTPGYDDGLEYFPSNETFRFVIAENSEGPAMFETVPFDEWASIKCAEASQQRAYKATKTRLGTDEFGSVIGEPSDPIRGRRLLSSVSRPKPEQMERPTRPHCRSRASLVSVPDRLMLLSH